jgi:hypothetical protein
MEAQIIDNMSRTMASELATAIVGYQDVRIAVAFMSQSGLDIIHPSINTNLRSGGRIEFLIGLDMNVTEPRALQTIYNLSRENENVTVYCHTPSTQEAIYHPKLYLFRANDNILAIIGSSNLTKSGLRSNTASKHDIVGWLEVVYTSLPNGEFRNKDMYVYEDVFQRKYPDNRNIKAKIRQQLQTLRDMGFVEHIGPGRWRKL